jgi:arylsulfatase
MWAQVSMTPFSQFKGYVAEGGIRNALVVSGPAVKRTKGSINNGLMHVSDIMPTLLEIAGANYPKTHEGQELPALIGKSWGQVLAGQAESPRTEQDAIAWELFGNRAVRQGEWKLRWQYKSFGKGEWELFNLTADPGERKDLAAERPDKLKELLALWDGYVRTNNVILPNRSVFETQEDQLPPRVPVDVGFPPLVNKRQFIPPKDMMAEPKKR